MFYFQINTYILYKCQKLCIFDNNKIKNILLKYKNLNEYNTDTKNKNYNYLITSVKFDDKN